MQPYYQQGDVLLFKVDSIPEGAEKIEGHNGVLAEGEESGHLHRMVKPVDVFKGPVGPHETSTDIYMAVPKRIDLVHTKGMGSARADHFREPIEPGIYNVGRVREYDYAAREARRVVD